MTLDDRPQVNALVRLLAAVALDVRRARLAHRPTVLALRHRPSLLVDVLQWPIMMLAVANTMASHTGLASPLLSVNKHGGWLSVATCLNRPTFGTMAKAEFAF